MGESPKHPIETLDLNNKTQGYYTSDIFEAQIKQLLEPYVNERGENLVNPLRGILTLIDLVKKYVKKRALADLLVPYGYINDISDYYAGELESDIDISEYYPIITEWLVVEGYEPTEIFSVFQAMERPEYAQVVKMIYAREVAARLFSDDIEKFDTKMAIGQDYADVPNVQWYARFMTHLAENPLVGHLALTYLEADDETRVKIIHDELENPDVSLVNESFFGFLNSIKKGSDEYDAAVLKLKEIAEKRIGEDN